MIFDIVKYVIFHVAAFILAAMAIILVVSAAMYVQPVHPTPIPDTADFNFNNTNNNVTQVHALSQVNDAS